MKHKFKIGDEVRLKSNAIEILKRICDITSLHNDKQGKKFIIRRIETNAFMKYNGLVYGLGNKSNECIYWPADCVEHPNIQRLQMLEIEESL